MKVLVDIPNCGNDLKRAFGHPELQKERELPKAPQSKSEG